MSWLEPVSTAVTAASLAQTLAGSSSSVRRHAIRIWNYIRHGSAVVPIFGAGGSGKSTISRLLSGTDPLDFAFAYDESWSIEREALTGTIPGHILVSPGQLERKDRNWPALLAEITAGRSPIIFNVVSFGYHSFSVPSFTELDQYEDGQTPSQFVEVFSAHRRELENQLLAELLAGIRHVDHPLCLVTVVNKQDLWWDTQPEVRSSYESGDYGKQLQSFIAEVGGRGIQHEFIPISSVVTNFVTPNGEMLKCTCAGYDQATHLRHLHAFFSKVDTVMQEAMH